MEHLHACCVCKNACRIEGSRFHCLGRRGKPKDNRKKIGLVFPFAELESASICLGLTFLYPIFEEASRVKAESAIVCRSSIARSPYREFSLWLCHQLTFLSVSVHSRTLTNSHIGYVPDPFPSVTQRIKWPADGWGLVYETSSTAFGGTRSLFPQCINILQCRHFVTGPYTYVSSLSKAAAFSSTAKRYSTSYIRSTSYIAKLRIAS